MDKIEALQDLNARLQMKMSLNADEAMAEQSRLKSRIAYLEGTALPHARKQAHADGFQAGWHAVLQRIENGDGIIDLEELASLVPKPAETDDPAILPNQDCVIHLPRPDCQIGHAHIIDSCGAFEPKGEAFTHCRQCGHVEISRFGLHNPRCENCGEFHYFEPPAEVSVSDQDSDDVRAPELFKKYINLQERYHDLLLCVSKKYPEETRHQTAKRMLLQHDRECGQGGPVSETGNKVSNGTSGSVPSEAPE